MSILYICKQAKKGKCFLNCSHQRQHEKFSECHCTTSIKDCPQCIPYKSSWSDVKDWLLLPVTLVIMVWCKLTESKKQRNLTDVGDF